MFERFTDQARRVMALASQEAQCRNHEFVRTEHILLGLVKSDSCVGAKVLKIFGVDLPEIVTEIEKLVPSGPGTVTTTELPKTSQSTRVIEVAIEESQVLEHDYVGTEHLLLGLMCEPRGIVGRVLASSKLTLEGVREGVLEFLETEDQE